MDSGSGARRDGAVENIARWVGRTEVDKQTEDGLRELYAETSLPVSIRACVGISLLLLRNGDVVDALKGWLRSAEMVPYVKKKLAETLIECGEHDIAVDLVHILRQDLEPESSFVRLKMVELNAALGDLTINGQLLDILEDEAVKPLIRARVADALSALGASDHMPRVKAFVANENFLAAVRGRAVQCLVDAEDGVDCLMELLDRPDIGEDAYLALFRAARRSGQRILACAEGGYRSVPIHKPEA